MILKSVRSDLAPILLYVKYIFQRQNLSLVVNSFMGYIVKVSLD